MKEHKTSKASIAQLYSPVVLKDSFILLISPFSFKSAYLQNDELYLNVTPHLYIPVYFNNL